MQNYTNKKYLAKQIADKSFLIDEQANMLEFTLNLISWDFNRSLQTRPVEGLRLCTAGIIALGDALTEGTLHDIILTTLLIEGLKLHFLHTFILLLQVGKVSLLSSQIEFIARGDHDDAIATRERPCT